MKQEGKEKKAVNQEGMEKRSLAVGKKEAFKHLISNNQKHINVKDYLDH